MNIPKKKRKVKEVEKEHVFEEFKNRVGEIITGDIRQLNRDEIFLNAEGTEVVLKKHEQIPNETLIIDNIQ